MSDDQLVFADEQDASDGSQAPPWTILIVDDEEEIHAVTKLALAGFTFSDRPLEFLSAFSGQEAREIMERRPDVAMILLDVVMETDHAGLDTARFIRNTLRNRFVRIILRTGQPGQAPEREVIREYDINDYKEKTELTAKKLFTVVYTALRSHRDLMMIEANRRGLIKVLESATTLYKAESIEKFVQGVLEQLSSMIYDDLNMAYINSALAAERRGGAERIVAATGSFKTLVGKDPRNSLSPPDYHNLNLAMRKQRSVITPDHFSGYFLAEDGTQHLLYIGGRATLTTPDQALIDVFLKNVAMIFAGMSAGKAFSAGAAEDGSADAD